MTLPMKRLNLSIVNPKLPLGDISARIGSMGSLREAIKHSPSLMNTIGKLHPRS